MFHISCYAESAYFDYSPGEINDIPSEDDIDKMIQTSYTIHSEYIADRIIRYAESLKGQYEESNIFTEYFGTGKAAWCAMFVVYVLEMCGIPSNRGI